MATPTMQQVMDFCRAGQWRTAPKLYKNIAASGHNMYIHNAEGANPSFITPVLPVAFEVSAGKDKPIEPDSLLNMELSVREHNKDCIEFGDVIDRFVREAVASRIKELYPGMNENFLQMLQRRVMCPKKEFKFAPQPPYAWRFKLVKTTTYLVACGTDEKGKELYREGNRTDVKPGCNVRINGVFPKIYTSPTSFGPNFEADVVLIYPGGVGGRNKATAADNFGFGDDCSITVVQVDAAAGDEEAEGAHGAEGGEGGGGGEGAGESGMQSDNGGGGAYDDGTSGAQDDTKAANDGSSSSGSKDNTDDAAPDNKRSRNSDPYE